MNIIRITCCAAAVTLAAGLVAETNENLTARQKLIKEHREFIMRTGGYVIKPDAGNRAVVIANAQTRVPVVAFRRALGYMRFAAKINFDLRTLKTAEEPYAKMVKETNAAVLIVVVDKPESSSPILVSPDERWTVVNVAALASDKPGDTVLQTRFRAALTRAICYACGGGSSKNKSVPTSPLTGGVADYDRLMAESLGPDQIAFMTDYLFELGSRQILRVTYDVACQQGWAPAPTNAIQKAVWEKVHKVPDKPMKIKFDPAAQKGKVTK